MGGMKTERGQFVETIIESDSTHDLAFHAHQLINQRRQFAMSFDGYGIGTITAPMVGPRNPMTPQPQPPISQAIAA
jgi:hypothetical protein